MNEVVQRLEAALPEVPVQEHGRVLDHENLRVVDEGPGDVQQRAVRARQDLGSK